MELMLLECMTHLGLYTWMKIGSQVKSYQKLRFISYAYNHTYCQKNIKIFTFTVHSCRSPAVLSFYYKSTNKSFLSRNLFKADFSQNANNFHQEKNLFWSYDCTVIFSWCLCSFLSLVFFFYLNIVKFWKGTTPRKGVLLATAYFLSWWLMQVKCCIQ